MVTLVRYNKTTEAISMANVARMARQAYEEAIEQATKNGNVKLASKLQKCYDDIYMTSMEALDAVCDLQDVLGNPIRDEKQSET